MEANDHNSALQAGLTNSTEDGRMGGNSTADRARFRDQAHRATAMLGAITSQRVISRARGMLTGTTSDTKNSKQ